MSVISMSCQDLSGNSLYTVGGVQGFARLKINNSCVVKQHRQDVVWETPSLLVEQLEYKSLPVENNEKNPHPDKFNSKFQIFDEKSKQLF